jgi:mitofusin
VSKALSEEIDCLSVLVDEFNLSFGPEQLVLNEYKKELHHHVQNGLSWLMREKLSAEFTMYIEKGQREITGNK